VSGFQEYPIKGDTPWDGSDSSQAGAQGNDRVIFQYNKGTGIGYFCGIVRHPGRDGVDNHFQLCQDAPKGAPEPAAVAPYAQGTCSLHLTQWDYEDLLDGPRYDVEVKMFDDAKNQIGFQERTGSQGDTPVFVASALEDWLTVTAESQNDYIAFNLAPQSWPSNGEFGPGDTPNPCSVGGWDCSDFPCVSFSDRAFIRGRELTRWNSIAKWTVALAALGPGASLRLRLSRVIAPVISEGGAVYGDSGLS